MAASSKRDDGGASSGADGARNPARTASAKHVIPWVLIIALGLGIAVIGVLKAEYGLVFSAATAWGLALYVTGIFLGFLFGIPRVIERDRSEPGGRTATSPSENKEPAANGTDARLAKSTVNSNLVEVSDWLTKIIVGVGLVELKNLPDYGERLAAFMATSFATTCPGDGTSCFVSIAGAIALYFGVLGFITGYLLTRVFLAVIMNLADRDAELAGQELLLPAGTRVTVGSALTSLHKEIADLQSKMAAPAVTPPPEEAEAPAPSEPAGAVEPPPAMVATFTGAAPSLPELLASSPAAFAGPPVSPPAAAQRPARPRTLLWVDDHPENNALLVDRLVGAGFQIHTARTTQAALQRLEAAPVSLVITDMHRTGEGSAARPAGLALLSALGELGLAAGTMQACVYCSKAAAQRYGDQARRAGAALVTASPTDLMAFIQQVFGEIEG